MKKGTERYEYLRQRHPMMKNLLDELREANALTDLFDITFCMGEYQVALYLPGTKTIFVGLNGTISSSFTQKCHCKNPRETALTAKGIIEENLREQIKEKVI
jgi:hypothetical protein